VRRAPPVRFVIVEPAAWRALELLLGALTAAVLAAWVALHAGASDRSAFGLTCLAGSAWGLAAWLRPPGADRLLAWDGGAWSLDGQPGGVRLMMDFGGWLLIRFAASATNQAHWLVLSDSPGPQDGERHALRVALNALGPASAVVLGVDADRAV